MKANVAVKYQVIQNQHTHQLEIEKILELKGLVVWDDDLEQIRQYRTIIPRPSVKGLQ